ncbi:ParA family protein [Acidisphaera sp. L21]|uniref:nucleotide-binding protein n=1 Tax=Acidisphaera sp. L21 TaxID=1641851 RepID=UPI00131D16E7|nr:ParA family protein [Acidisphaera sp. L21]
MASRKGGAGTTTIASALAVEAVRRGHGPVVMLDTDPQGGLAGWWNAREADTPVFVEAAMGELRGTLAALEERGFAIAFIDTPPQVSEAISAVIQVADIVIVPVRASPNDLRAVSATVDLIEEAAKRMIFIVNAVKPRVKLTAETAILLSQHGTVAPIHVADRTDYAGAMTDGRTGPEMDPLGKAAAEIAALWTYIAQKIGIESRNAKQAAPTA